MIAIRFEGITVDEYKNKCMIEFLYGFHQTPFGKCLIAIVDTNESVAYLAFVDDDETEAIRNLKAKWPLTRMSEDPGNKTGNIVTKIFYSQNSNHSICVFMKGTKFQMKVWRALTENIPEGMIVTYEEVAQMVDCKAPIAVGNAISKNYIAYLVPCHRVTMKNGDDRRAKYVWGMERKKAILEYEKPRLSLNNTILTSI